MLKKTPTRIALFVAIGALPSAPLLAQSAAKDAAEAAADAVEAAAEGADKESEYNAGEAVDAAAYAVEAPRHPDEPYALNYPGDVIGHADYPAEAWVADMQGSVAFELAVDEMGAVTDCTITESSGHALLDQLTCALLSERMEFVPATDKQGNPVAGTYSNSYSWVKREPDLSSSFNVLIRYTVDENGAEQNCEIVELSEGAPSRFRESIERAPCGFSPGGVPYRDAEGNPVAREVTFGFEVTLAEPSSE